MNYAVCILNMTNKLKDKADLITALIVFLFVIILIFEKAKTIDRESNMNRGGIENTK